MDLIDIFLALVTATCLFASLTFKLHRNHALFIFTCFVVISNCINPILFLANEDMYTYTGWSAVRSYDFSIESLIHSYSSSNWIYSLIAIILLSLSISFGSSLRHSSIFKLPYLNMKINAVLTKRINYDKYLMIVCIFLIVAYFPLYNNQIGVTGLPGELPFRLSGAVHYVRSYIIPIFLVILLSNTSGKNIVVVMIMLYAFVAGVSAASRFVGLLPLVLLCIFFIRQRRYIHAIISILYSLFIWFAVTTSRDLTFDGQNHDLFEVLYYSLTSVSFDNVVNSLDLLTGRISGAQQIVLVHQYKSYSECKNIVNFLLGSGDVCSDTASIIYGLDLSGTLYGLGLSLIPSIIVSADSALDFFVPVFYISSLLWMSQCFFLRLKIKLGWHGIADLYIFLSVLFIFLGQLYFFYILQLTIIFSFIGYSLWKRTVIGRKI